MLRALQGPQIRLHLQDGCEAVFARGALAAAGQAPEEWRPLFDLATTPSTQERTSTAAAQALLFCEEPWFLDFALQRLGASTSIKDPVVVGAFLLRLGAAGGPEGVLVLRDYLSNPGRKPTGRADWDVRQPAAVGLLRALEEGRARSVEARTAILDALDSGVKRGLSPGPFRDALERVVERDGLEVRRLLEVPDSVLPEARVLEVERAAPDPHGLLARDPRDVAVVRLNDLLPVVFNVTALKPGLPGARDKSEQPRRFLMTCQGRFPYFTRLDLHADRGRRPPPALIGGEAPEREVRRP